jgi:hypothetical protein
MTTTIIVVLDEGDSHRGEIMFAESVEQAERILETTLQSGVERTRLRVFNGIEHCLQVSYRPIVQLGGSADGDRTPAAAPEAPDTPEDSESREGSLRFSSLFRRDPPISDW